MENMITLTTSLVLIALAYTYRSIADSYKRTLKNTVVKLIIKNQPKERSVIEASFTKQELAIEGSVYDNKYLSALGTCKVLMVLPISYLVTLILSKSSSIEGELIYILGSVILLVTIGAALAIANTGRAETFKNNLPKLIMGGTTKDLSTDTREYLLAIKAFTMPLFVLLAVIILIHLPT